MRFAACQETLSIHADRDSFVCVGSYSRKHNKVGHPPEEYAAACSSPGKSANKAGGGLPSETAGKSSTKLPTRPAGASGYADAVLHAWLT